MPSTPERALTALVACLAGAYLLAVAYQGNAHEFLDAIGEDKGVILWLIAAAVLVYGGRLVGGDSGAKIGTALLSVAFLAFLLQSGENLAATLQIVLIKLQGNGA